MKRYFLRLAYNGARFCGWQRQPDALSVQQVIEQALSTVLRVPTPIVGAGRTDAGVHARCMYAHFDAGAPIENKSKFLRSLNFMCGSDIAFYELTAVSPEAHARFDATLRTYKYFLAGRKTPFLNGISYQPPYPLDFRRMNEAAEVLLHCEDFTSFSKLHTDVKTNICNVSHARWESEGDMQVFTISADRFLRNMVRAVVGTLLDVGRGKISIADFRKVIEAKDRCRAGTSMPPQALFLWDIKYPYIRDTVS